jgi:hypothetical protein
LENPATRREPSAIRAKTVLADRDGSARPEPSCRPLRQGGSPEKIGDYFLPAFSKWWQSADKVLYNDAAKREVLPVHSAAARGAPARGNVQLFSSCQIYMMEVAQVLHVDLNTTNLRNRVWKILALST